MITVGATPPDFVARHSLLLGYDLAGLHWLLSMGDPKASIGQCRCGAVTVATSIGRDITPTRLLKTPEDLHYPQKKKKICRTHDG